MFNIGNGQALKVLGFVYRKKLSYAIFCIQGKARPFRLKNFLVHKSKIAAERELEKYLRDNGYI